MLQDNNPTVNSLLQKYDNSSLMPVGAAHQTDYSKIHDSELANNDNDTINDSDDTVIIQQEIEDTIGESSNKHNTNITTPETPAKSRHDAGLLVETTENNATLDTSIGLPVETITNSDTLDTSSITKDLSKSSVTPVSPNRGKVVFKSYRLWRRATNNDNETSDRLKDLNTVSKPNSENDIQLANIPSRNSTRPPPPDKYKIRKFQIDKVHYYTYLYCNKHFESIHYLNNHHSKNHPPVSCDICNKLYDTPNSLIRHSYTHLSGNYQWDNCSESFHFKSELYSHKNKHSDRRFQCKKCNRSFIRNADLNARLDTHGKKWKCTFKGCNKECADRCYLSTHMKIHSDELKYPCRKCKKRFCFYEQRKQHENDHPWWTNALTVETYALCSVVLSGGVLNK